MLGFSSMQGADSLPGCSLPWDIRSGLLAGQDCRMREDSGSKYSRIAASPHASWMGVVWQITSARVLSSCVQPRSAETMQGVLEVEVESKTASYRRSGYGRALELAVGYGLAPDRERQRGREDEGGSGLPRKTRHSWSTPGYDELGQVLRKMGTLLVTWEHKTRLRRPGRMGRCQPNLVPSCCRCCR